MTLSIAIAAAGLLLRWDVPAAGSYTLFSTTDYTDARIEVSNHVDSPCHAAATITNPDPHRMFWVWFQPDPEP